MEENIDILQHLDNLDLTTVDRSRKNVAGTMEVTIKAIEVQETKPTEKNPKGGHRLAIQLTTNHPVAGVNEEDKNIQVEAGHLIFDSISLVPTEKYNPMERLADIQLATTGQQVKGFKPADYIGKTAIIKCKIEDSEDYGKQTRVSRWLPKKAPTTTASL